MWTTKITSVTKQDLYFGMTVEFYKDGLLKHTFTFERVSDPNSIPQLIRDQLSQYQKIDVVNDVTLIGNIDVAVAIPITAPPTKEATDLQAYNQQRQLLVLAKQDLDLGLLDKAIYDSMVLATLAIKPK